MPLPQDVIEAQQFGFSVCAGESTVDATQNDIFGEKDCYCDNQARAMFYWWAVDVLARTPIEGDDDECCPKCVTDEFACEVIRTMSPGCITCGCGNPDDVPESCDIVPDITVFQALDADNEPTLPQFQVHTTLIISDLTDAGNEWADHVGDIATGSGPGTFTYYTPPVGTIVFDSATATNYITYAGGAGPYYPIIDGNQVSTTLTLVSRSPSITASMTRTVVVEVSEDDVTWLPVYSGPEAPLATATVTYTLAFGYSPIYTRTTYFWGEYLGCSYRFSEGTIPPYVPPPCGILVYSITPDSICATDNWTIDVEFTQIDGWALGTITPTVNGTPGTAVPITLGTMSFGPYIMGDLVTFDLVSNLDAACDITTPTYFDPRFDAIGEQDFNVLRAVDADEYAALNGDGNDYYIVSNVNSIPVVPGEWSDNIGSIWLGGSSTYQAVANLELVYATNPGGALGFWQLDVATAKQLFPQPTLTTNTVTLVTVPTLPPVAPFTQAWATLLVQGLWTPPTIGSPATVYSGAPGSFVGIPFTAATGSTISGLAAYSDGCAVRVPALLATFTPTGVVDPDYVGLGVNDVVYDIVSQPGGGVIIVGAFIEYNPDSVGGPPIPANGITRLDTNGVIDTAYNNIVNNPLLPATGQGCRGFSRENSPIVLTLAGTGVVNGTYEPQPPFNGRYLYSLAGGYVVEWTGTQWRVRNGATIYYTSNDDVEFPSQVTTWAAVSGVLPVPTVSQSFAATAYAALKDSQGRVYVGGNFTHMNDVYVGGIVRLLTDGSRDPSFTNPGVTYPANPQFMFISGLAVDNVDRVVACGWFERCGSVFVGDTMRMLESNGALDTAFNNNVRNGFFFRVPKVRYDATDDSFVYNSAQPPATTWDFGPAAAPAFPAPNANTAIVTPTAGPGGIPFTTGSITVRKTAVRLYGGNLPDCGKLKSIVALGAQFEEVGHPVTPNLVIQSDGKILFTGTFTYYAGTAANHIVRTDDMGGTDLVFEAGSGSGFNSGTSGVDLLPNGQILVGSDLPGAVYTDSTAVPKNVLGLIRLKADGTADTAWNIGTGFDNFVTTAKVDDFGKVWVGGGFVNFNSVVRNHIAKLL